MNESPPSETLEVWSDRIEDIMGVAVENAVEVNRVLGLYDGDESIAAPKVAEEKPSE